MWLFYYFDFERNYVLKSQTPTKMQTFIKTKRNWKWKIPHTPLGRWTLCFRSCKNCKLKVKLWRVGARERKNSVFCNVSLFCFLSAGYFFSICVLSVSSVLSKLSEYIYFYLSKNITSYFFCCFFLKSSNAFSVSLRTFLLRWGYNADH